MVYAPPAPQQQRAAARPTVDVKLPSGFDMMLTSIGAVENEVRKTARDMGTMVQQQAMFFERTYETNAETVKALNAISESMNETLKEVRRSQQPTAGDGDDQRGPQPRAGGPPGVGTREVVTGGPGPDGGGEWQTTSEMAGAAHAAEQRRAEQMGLQQARQRYAQARGRPVQTFREDLMRGVTRRISEMESAETPLMQDPNTGRWRDPTTGRFVATAAGESYARRAQVRNMARNVATNVGERGVHQGILQSLPSGAVRALGTGAAVVGAVEGGLQLAERTRAAGLQYQSALGVSAGEAQLERAGAAMFSLGQRGTMSRQQAGQLYQGITAMGLSDGRRDQALDFSTDMYKELGMSVSESMDVVRIAIENGVRSFEGLASSLEGVTEAAAEAGMSASDARRSFMRNYSQIAATIGGGQGAVAAAEAATVAQQAMGRRFGDMQTNTFGIDNLRMLAATQGVSTAELHRTAQTQAGAQQVVQMDAARQERVIANSSAWPQGVDAARSFVLQFLRDRGYDTEDFNNLGDDVWRAAAQALGEAGLMNVDPEAAVAILEHAGIRGVNINNAYEMLVRSIMGAGPGRVQAAQMEQNQENLSLREDERMTQRQDLADPGGAFAEQEREDIFGSNFEWNPSRWGVARRSHRIQDSYVEQAMASGQRSGLVEEIVQGDPDRMFRVRTADGDRVVTLEEAVRDFSDQLISGEASIYSGANAGSSVAEAYGFQSPGDDVVDQWREGALGGTRSDQNADLADVGMTLEEAQEEFQGGSASGASSGHITISPSPELEQLLRFQTEGDIDIDLARYAGVPPGDTAPPAHGPTH